MLLQIALDQTTAQNAAPQGVFSATQWVEQVLIGPLGTSLAVVAVAWFGFVMLTGRLSPRRGGLLVLGCFVLFNASDLARALVDLARGSGSASRPIAAQQITVPLPPTPKNPPPYDPYAGAAVPNANN